LPALPCRRPASSASCRRLTPDPRRVHAQADDLGWNDLGHFNGGLTLTKNIDGLIAQGVLLDRFHTFKVCAPSRASTMSGRYPFNVVGNTAARCRCV
jgi:arylsulfatase A-like enzyme